MSPSDVPPLLLLAGTSEAGKSTAGLHLSSRGADRIKIRTLLLTLTTGSPVTHEGVATREGFEPYEFIDALRRRCRTESRVAVVESFIDAGLCRQTRDAWPGPVAVVFVTADEALRCHRLATTTNISEADALAIIRSKDARKRVGPQLAEWDSLADHWIDNRNGLAQFSRALDAVYDDLVRGATEESPR